MTERANHRRRAVHNFSIIQLHHNLPQPRAIHRLAPSSARPSSSSSRSFERPASSSHAHRRQSRHQSPDHDHAHRAHAHERLFRRRRVSTVPPRPLIEHELNIVCAASLCRCPRRRSTSRPSRAPLARRGRSVEEVHARRTSVHCATMSTGRLARAGGCRPRSSRLATSRGADVRIHY